jgi:transposase
LYFGDASYFSTVPCVPYAWQNKDEPILLDSFRSKSLSVLGLMTSCGKLFQKTYQENINSEIMINFVDEFCETITKKTVVILDNSSIHKSKIFTEKIKEWEEKDLFIYFIPPYCPELNLIENLWRFIKYRWLDFSSYLNFDTLKNNLNEVLENFGTKYMSNFL